MIICNMCGKEIIDDENKLTLIGLDENGADKLKSYCGECYIGTMTEHFNRIEKLTESLEAIEKEKAYWKAIANAYKELITR